MRLLVARVGILGAACIAVPSGLAPFREMRVAIGARCDVALEWISRDGTLPRHPVWNGRRGGGIGGPAARLARASLLRMTLATALLCPLLALAQLHPASSHLRLAIKVPNVMRMALLDHPRSVDVTPEDIARGFVRVRGPRVEILSNHRGGYVVRAELTNAAFESANVAGLPAPIRVVTNAASSVAMPSMVGARRPGPAAVEYVLRLARHTTAGPQPWPVALAIEAP